MLIAVFIVCAAIPVLAYPKSSNYTYDGTGTLSEEELSSIADSSAKLSEKKGARVAVCIVNSVVQVGGESGASNLETAVKDYARAVFKEWKIGNGVLLLISKEDKVYWAVQSNSLTKTLTDEKLKSILSEKLDDSFDGNLAEGVVGTAKALDEFLTSALPDVKAEKSILSKIFGIILKIILAIAILLIAGYVALIILERRALEKRRRYMEARRREMAARGRNRGRRTNQNRLPRPNETVRRSENGRYIEYASVYDPNPRSDSPRQLPPASSGRRQGDPMNDSTVAFPMVNRGGSKGNKREITGDQSGQYGNRQNIYK